MENTPTTRPAEDSFQIMDRLDDEIIEAELKNRVIDTWSYSFKGNDGRLQEGLSKVGVDEACVEMSKRGYIIREGIISMEKDPIYSGYVLFQVPASLIRITNEGKEMLLDVVNGTKRQWIKMKLRTGQIVDDPFWFEKGAMKAARNARSRLIPSETKTRILVLARKGNKVKNIDSDPEPPSGPPNKAKAARSPKSASNDTSKTDKLDFSGRINCPEQIDSEGSPRSILKLTCKTCDKRNVCPMWQNTPPESQDGGPAATSPDDAGESIPKYNIPDKIPWTGKAAMIAMLRELQEKEPLAFSGMAVYYEVEPTKFNALTEQQAWEFYRDVLKAANEGGKFA